MKVFQLNTEPTTYNASEVAAFMRSREKHGDLSNMTFAGLALRWNRLDFQCSEGLYQALKFPHDPDLQRSIGAARSGMEAKKLAYAPGNQPRPDWDHVRVDAMALALSVKLEQHPIRITRALLETGDKPIVEKSYRDAFWGAKPGRNETVLTGVNVLGQLLTLLRDVRRETRKGPAGAAEEFRGMFPGIAAIMHEEHDPNCPACQWIPA